MKTLLLSALTRQFLIQGKRFAELHPNDWLVWEGGTLTVPRGVAAAVDTVSQPLDAGDSRPRIGDPLCFVLAKPGEGTTVTIGRAEGNDLVLSDSTVSRHHCTLVFTDGRWRVSAAEQGHSLDVDGVEVPFGQFVSVSSGQAMRLGHLVLRLYTAQGMLLRLAQLMARR